MIHLLLNLQEEGETFPENKEYAETQYRDGSQQDTRQFEIDAYNEKHRHDKHQRRAQHQAHRHHDDLLDAADVTGQAGNKRSRTEPVDVEERELLYLAEKAGAQIGSETNGCMGRYVDIGNAENQSDNGDQYHLSAHGSDDGEVSLHHSVVYNIRHVHRLNGFAHHRHEYQQRACQQAYLVLLQYLPVFFHLSSVITVISGHAPKRKGRPTNPMPTFTYSPRLSSMYIPPHSG